jgi:hypothetical protein
MASYDDANKVWQLVNVPSSSIISNYQPHLSIDLAELNVPDWISGVSGLSFVEEWGRWADKNIAPSVRIVTRNPLPKSFTLYVSMRSIIEGIVIISVGKQRQKINVTNLFSEFSLSFDNTYLSNIIDITLSIDDELIQSVDQTDQRNIYLGIKYIRILDNTTSNCDEDRS